MLFSTLIVCYSLSQILTERDVNLYHKWIIFILQIYQFETFTTQGSTKLLISGLWRFISK